MYRKIHLTASRWEVLGASWEWVQKQTLNMISRLLAIRCNRLPIMHRYLVLSTDSHSSSFVSLVSKDLRSKEEVKFSHHDHLEFVMHDFGKIITHVLTSRIVYDVIDIYLNDDEIKMDAFDLSVGKEEHFFALTDLEVCDVERESVGVESESELMLEKSGNIKCIIHKLVWAIMTFNDNLLRLNNLDENLGYLVSSSQGWLVEDLDNYHFLRDTLQFSVSHAEDVVDNR
nr:hypothetical protein [Tanacetum cinerariifolium]